MGGPLGLTQPGIGQRLAGRSACQGPISGQSSRTACSGQRSHRKATEPVLQADRVAPQPTGGSPLDPGALASQARPSPSAVRAAFPQLVCRAHRTRGRQQGAWPLLAAGHPTLGRRAHFYAPSVPPNPTTLAFGGHGIRTRARTAPHQTHQLTFPVQSRGCNYSE